MKHSLLSFFAHYRKFFLLFMLPFMILLSSCAVTGALNQEISYISPNFNIEAVEAGGLSMLPVVATSGLENLRRPFGTLINDETDSLVTNFMPMAKTLDRMNSNGLVSDFNTAVRDYRETSIIDRSLLTRLHEATGNNYFLYVHLLEPTQEQFQRYSSIYERNFDTKRKTAGAVGMVWSVEDGDIVWEGNITIAVSDSEFTTIRGDDKDRIERIARAMVDSIFE